MQLTLWLVLAADSLLFLGIAFWGTAGLGALLLNSILAKSIGSTFFVTVAWWYLRRWERELPLPTAVGESRGLFAILTYRQKYEWARSAALEDALTGVFNRRYFDATASHDLEMARRMGQPMALILVDLDSFKQVNDVHGHLVGDAVLKAVAGYLATTRRRADYVARFGGEELVIVLPGADVSKAAGVADESRRAVEALFSRGLSPVEITCSMGVAAFPEDGPSLEAVLEVADRRLYLAKETGRNRVVASEPEGEWAPGGTGTAATR
nr:GGDEF domain-containing protein [Lysobacter sp. CAU 1642]